MRNQDTQQPQNQGTQQPQDQGTQTPRNRGTQQPENQETQTRNPQQPRNQEPINPVVARLNAKVTKYQYLIYATILLGEIPGMWHVFNLMLLNPPMTYHCEGANSTSTNTCPCSKPIWDRSVFTETVETRFGLICNRKYLISLSESLFYFGMLVGAFVFGVMSDKFGRMATFCITCVVTGVAGILVSVSPNMLAFYIFRVLEGAGAAGTIVTTFVLIIEYTATKRRELITGMYHFPINIANITIAGVSYLLRNAFHFQLAISIVPLFFAFIWLYVPESPLWLIDNKYKERTNKTLEKIAKFNNEPDPTIREEVEAYCNRGVTGNQVHMQIYHILKYRRLTKNFACMSYLYFICGMGFYGVSQYISKMSGDIFVNIALSGFLVLPGTSTALIMLMKAGRKPFLATACMGSGIFMLITVVIPRDANVAKVIFACAANCFFFMAFIIVFLFGVELFPTQVRNSALGFMSLISRAGMMAAPQINSLHPTVAGCLFAAFALIGGFLTLCLPETKNKELPTTLEEAELQR